MKHLIYSLLLLAVACVLPSCVEEEQQPATPVIECESAVTVPPEGGDVVFPVVITNPVPSATLVVEASGDWINDLQFADSHLTFTATANETGEKRSTEIKLSYEGAQDVTVTVSQEAVVVPVMFTFEVTDVKTTKAVVRIFPEDKEATYLSLVLSKEVYESLGSDEAVCDHVVSYYSSYGSVTDFLMIGDREMTASNLSAETTYVVLAFGFDGELPTTAVDTISFETLPPPSIEDVKFEINVTEITGESVTVRFTPDPVYYKYAVAAVPAADKEAFGSDISKWDGYMKGVADKFIQSGAISSYEEYVNNACRREEFYVKIEGLEYSTEYYAAAILVDEHLDVLALPYLSEKFSTPEKPSQDPSIVLELTEYFDGTAIAEKYPEFASFKGKALVPVTGRFENSTYWVAGSMDKSMYDMYAGANYLEIALVQMNMCAERIYYEDYPESPFTHFFAIGWGRSMMITSIAYNDETKASKSDFSSVPVKPEQGSAADISEFEKYL